uniref:Uncharacterized protein n=1 Tax=Rhizophora mucronata TaxID=61149 RepID=A0A2P2P8G3_RHIMU
MRNPLCTWRNNQYFTADAWTICEAAKFIA